MTLVSTFIQINAFNIEVESVRKQIMLPIDYCIGLSILFASLTQGQRATISTTWNIVCTILHRRYAFHARICLGCCQHLFLKWLRTGSSQMSGYFFLEITFAPLHPYKHSMYASTERAYANKCYGQRNFCVS